MDHDVRDVLLHRAREVRERAHAPYSGFRVGAALMDEDGTIHVGCNVENASYGLTVCAERGAVSAAVTAGGKHFRALALSSSGSRPVAPCGACRQVLSEFAPALPILSHADGAGAEGVVEEWNLRDLFPTPFTSRHSVDPEG